MKVHLIYTSSLLNGDQGWVGGGGGRKSSGHLPMDIVYVERVFKGALLRRNCCISGILINSSSSLLIRFTLLYLFAVIPLKSVQVKWP